MLSKIVYILGIVAAIWCVLDILKRPWGILKKIIIGILVLITSWVGFVVYYLLRNKL